MFAAGARAMIPAKSLTDGPGAQGGPQFRAPLPGAPDEDASFSPGSDPRLLSAALEPRALAGLSPTVAAERARSWAKTLDGPSPLAQFASLLPPRPWFQARLIMERDEPDLSANAALDGAAGEAYRGVLSCLDEVRAAASALEAVLDALWEASDQAKALKPGPVAPVARSLRWMPARSSLDASHRYALDLFFTSVKRRGAEEIGPAIRSISRGIVVSAAGDWRGGDSLEGYRSGGLSPRSGNGVLVYCPDDGRYYAYFHLDDVTVKTGQLVGAGQVLGHGGNTGANARKKGHGEHLHVEIHTGPGEALSNYEIRDYLVDLK